MQDHGLRNGTAKAFIDVSRECWREYDYGGRPLRIDRPVMAHVGPDGSHRLLDAAGLSHYMAPGWRRMSFMDADRAGQPFGPEQSGFDDVTSERWRRYDWADGHSFRVDDPSRLGVMPDGSHRVLDAKGAGHRVAPGWVHIAWEAEAEKPHFVR